MASTRAVTGLSAHGWSGRTTGQVGPPVTRPRIPIPMAPGGAGPLVVVAWPVVVVGAGLVVLSGVETVLPTTGAVDVDVEEESAGLVEPPVAVGVGAGQPQAARVADATMRSRRRDGVRAHRVGRGGGCPESRGTWVAARW